jgi:hypothetical protein
VSTEDLEGDVQVAKYLERYDKALITNYRAFRLLARGWAGWPFFSRRTRRS